MISIATTFDNTLSFYFEGEKVCVKLKVTVEEPSEIDWLTATFVGVSKCIRQNPKEPSQTTIWHVVLPTKNEITKYHFNHPILVHKINSEKSNRLSDGPHEFNVAYQLPTHLPSSLESDEAYVRYYLYIVAEVNGEIIKKTEFFTVGSKVDLNNYLVNNIPAVIWLYQNLSPALCLPGDFFLCGLCRCGNIRAVLHVDKTGYVPGERIKVYAQIDNLSSRTIDWVKASFIQTVKFNCSKVIKRKRVVTEVLRGSVMPYESQVWRTEEIPIPALPPTTNDLIYVVYKLYLQIKPSWQEKTFTTKKKLVIGSIPVRDVDKSEKGQGDVNGDIISSDLGANFEPCFFGARDVEEEGIVTSFTPIYPVFEECNE